jgi:hypothetical protein
MTGIWRKYLSICQYRIDIIVRAHDKLSADFESPLKRLYETRKLRVTRIDLRLTNSSFRSSFPTFISLSSVSH